MFLVKYFIKMNSEVVKDIFKSILERKGYTFFDRGRFNLNIIGLRTSLIQKNKFDDFLYVIFKNDDGIWSHREYPITTDAGKHWLEYPINEKGTAILKPNQYRGGWKIGKHRSMYEALVQNTKVEVYRDNDRDMILDYDESKLDRGFFGINFHRSNPNVPSNTVDKWSAGCQVFKEPKHFSEFMVICELAKHHFGNTFTYTLLDKDDL